MFTCDEARCRAVTLLLQQENVTRTGCLPAAIFSLLTRLRCYAPGGVRAYAYADMIYALCDMRYESATRCLAAIEPPAPLLPYRCCRRFQRAFLLAAVRCLIRLLPRHFAAMLILPLATLFLFCAMPDMPPCCR